MAIDRRSFLARLGLAVGAVLAPGTIRAAAVAGEPPAHAALAGPLYVSACSDGRDGHAVAVFSADGRLRFTTRLPDRGHDAVRRPGSSEVVVFARRPGNWAAVVDLASGVVRQVIIAPEGRHFYGHGAFSADGRLMYATENDIAGGQGLLGLYAIDDAYRRVGEMPSFGIGPHDLAFLPAADGRRRLVVANGGIRTNPETGREILNKDALEPSLAIVDPAGGDCLVKVDLGTEFKALSIRHLDVARDGTTVFGCQYEGDPFDMPALVGVMTPAGETRFLEMPDEDLTSLANYIGSVSLDRSGTIIAATSPRGGMAAFWDLPSGRYLGRRPMADVCGVAPALDAETFVLTSGNAGVQCTAIPALALDRLGPPELAQWVWDNHLLLT